MDLFDIANKEEKLNNEPLAQRMRARFLNEFIGQKHIAGENSLLWRAIKLDRLGSCVFFGPPGTGKTTLANIIANATNGNFAKLNAVSSGVSDVKKVVDKAKEELRIFNKKTYLLLDECHRFSKTQMDSLLPSVEDGTVIFIGSTTENPYASMTPAIISRCRVFQFERLKQQEIKDALVKCLKDEKRGLGRYNLQVTEEALDHFSSFSMGDLRVAYNSLELAVLTTLPSSDGEIVVTLKDAEQSIGKKSLSYDESMYYDMLSAFCKSLRGSSSDGALYYSQRLIQGGCDPLLIARRLVVHASEDVGLADPMAQVVATQALLAFKEIGLPEGLIPLSNAIIYVAEAPKSNRGYLALAKAKNDAINFLDDNVPPHLKNAVYGTVEEKRESKNYKYPHDYGGYVSQQYLPNNLKDRSYYIPSENGFEKTITQIRKEKGQVVDDR